MPSAHSEPRRTETIVRNGGRRVWLGGFGKHPGWNDFIQPHLGQETPLMARAKRELFFGALRALVDTKRWVGVAGEKAFSPSEWRWVWQERDQFLMGVMWASQDGTGGRKGREYPMILCAQVEGADVFWGVEHLLPRLSEAAQNIRELKTSAEVVACVQATQKTCDELPAGTPPQYSARARALLDEECLRSPPEALARAFYHIFTYLGGLGIGAKEVGRKKDEEFGAMRLPCPSGNGSAGLGDWLAFLRAQIDNEAPILLFQGVGGNWCDAIFGAVAPDGEVSLANVLRLRQNLTAIPLISHTAYVIDADFQPRVEAALNGVNLAWGDPAKQSIFGSVPARYHPHLPGEAPTRDAVQDIIQKGGTRLGNLTEKTKITVDEGLVTLGSRRGFYKWLLAGAGAILAIGLALIAAHLWFPPAGSGSKSAKREDPRPDSPMGEEEGNKLKALWFDYVRDYYTNGLAVVVAGDGVRALKSAYVRTNLQAVLDKVGVNGFEPLEIYGDHDTLNLKSPELKVLQRRRTELQRVTDAREQIKNLLLREYPAKIAGDLRVLGGTPLQAVATTLAADGKIDSLSPEILSQVRRLGDLEQRAAELTGAWSDWATMRRAITNKDPQILGRLLAQQESGLASLADWAAVSNKLTAMRGEGRATLDWLGQAWPHIDQTAYSAEAAGTNIASLMAWTNFVEGYTRIFTDSDPRMRLSEHLDAVTNEVQDIVLAAQAGQASAVADAPALAYGLTQMRSNLHAVVGVIPIRKNEVALREQVNLAEAELATFSNKVQTAWVKVLDFQELVAQNRRLDFGAGFVNALWGDYLGRVDQSVRGKTPKPPREAVMLWRANLDAARCFFTNLPPLQPASLLGPPLNDPGLLRQPGVKDLLEFLLWDYSAQFVEQNLGRDLQFTQTFAAFLNDSRKVALDQTATSFSSALGRLVRVTAGVSRGGIPTLAELQGYRNDARGLAAVHLFPRVERSPKFRSLLELVKHDPYTEAEAGAAAEALRNHPPPSFAQVGISLALLNEAANWPRGVKDWQATVGAGQAARQLIARTASELDVESANKALAVWLDRQWMKVSPNITSFSQIKACAEGGGTYPPAELPLNLRQNYDLARLVDSFNGTNVGDFQVNIGEFLKNHTVDVPGGVTAVQRGILDQIRDVPPIGTDANSLAPSKRGLHVRLPADNVAQVDRAGFTNEFQLMEVPGVSSVFVSKSEFSCDAFVGLANGSTNVLVPWLMGLSKSMNEVVFTEIKPYEHPYNYFNNLMLGDLSGTRFILSVHGSRMSVKGGKIADSALLQKYAVVTGASPVNFVSPQLAVWVADAWGCRLLTPMEWTAIDRTLPEASAINLRHKQFEAVYQELDRKVGGPAKLLASLFFESVTPADLADAPAEEDGTGLLAGANDARFQQGGLIHWRGNVAEILKDGPQFYAAGGSFASPRSARPDPKPIPANQSDRGYADVGFRLAFDRVGIRPAERIGQLLAQLKPSPAPLTR